MLLIRIQISICISSLIRILTGRILDSKDAKFLHADKKDWSDCADAQADLSLHCLHMSEGMISQVGAHFSL